MGLFCVWEWQVHQGSGEAALRAAVSEGLAPGGQRRALPAFSGANFLFGRENRETLAGNGLLPAVPLLLALACGERPRWGESPWLGLPHSILSPGSPGGDMGLFTMTANATSPTWFRCGNRANVQCPYLLPPAGFPGLPLVSAQPPGLVASPGFPALWPQGSLRLGHNRQVLECCSPLLAGSPFINRLELLFGASPCSESHPLRAHL